MIFPEEVSLEQLLAMHREESVYRVADHADDLMFAPTSRGARCGISE